MKAYLLLSVLVAAIGIATGDCAGRTGGERGGTGRTGERPLRAKPGIDRGDSGCTVRRHTTTVHMPAIESSQYPYCPPACPERPWPPKPPKQPK